MTLVELLTFRSGVLAAPDRCSITTHAKVDSERFHLVSAADATIPLRASGLSLQRSG